MGDSRGFSVARGTGAAEVRGPAARLEHPAFRLMLKPPGPAERSRPACITQLLRLFQAAATSLADELFHGIHH